MHFFQVIKVGQLPTPKMQSFEWNVKVPIRGIIIYPIGKHDSIYWISSEYQNRSKVYTCNENDDGGL